MANELPPHETFVKGRRGFGNIARATSTLLLTVLLPGRNMEDEASILDHRNLLRATNARSDVSATS